MGYTHYWTVTGSIDQTKWNTWADMVRSILGDSSVAPLVCREYDASNEQPEVSGAKVAFNGRDDDGHETFYVTPSDDGFAFCKTAHKPYDTAVTACLIALAATIPNVSISSDGRIEDWSAGLSLVRRTIPSLNHINSDMVKEWLKR